MRYNCYLLIFIAFAITALALPTKKTADNSKWVPDKYESEGANFDHGQWVPKGYEKKKDDGSWHPSKYEGKGTGLDDGKGTLTKYPDDKSKIRRDKVDTIDDESGSLESTRVRVPSLKVLS
ncbi:hypothetical protein FGADI_7655 [Fusarium gaditjirri]|uniref:Uncharacterized protein n=1 Tax=Fusarium gaditjirri TaxID=282569 RepID=A0A8H4T4G9_9HYPO|nr:hypothetical protein FGADI_7655 [Fusarium gaditjirri]